MAVLITITDSPKQQSTSLLSFAETSTCRSAVFTRSSIDAVSTLTVVMPVRGSNAPQATSSALMPTALRSTASRTQRITIKGEQCGEMQGSVWLPQMFSAKLGPGT